MKKRLIGFLLILSLFSISLGLFAKDDSQMNDREIIEQMKTEFKLMIDIYSEHINILQQILANKIAKFNNTPKGTINHTRLKREIESTKIEINEAKKQMAEFDDIMTNPKREKELNSQIYNRLKALIDTIKYSEFVYFDSGKIDVSTAGMLTLKEFKRYIKDKKNFVIIVQGHADSTPLGPKLKRIYGNNAGLSLARAKEVRNYLVDYLGLPDSIIILEGKSFMDPISSNKASNRRVELIIKPKKMK